MQSGAKAVEDSRHILLPEDNHSIQTTAVQIPVSVALVLNALKSLKSKNLC